MQRRSPLEEGCFVLYVHINCLLFLKHLSVMVINLHLVRWGSFLILVMSTSIPLPRQIHFAKGKKTARDPSHDKSEVFASHIAIGAKEKSSCRLLSYSCPNNCLPFLKDVSVTVRNLLGGRLPYVCWVPILKLDLLVLVPIYHAKKIQ